MKISYNWLKDYINIDQSPEKIGELLTKAGLEVEKIEEFETIKGGLKGMVIGEVLTCEKHPGADKLKKTTVNIGKEIVPIVCGAANVDKGQKVIVATVGTTLFPAKGESFKINKAKIRGEVSEGMICAEDEIGIGESHDGIIVIETPLPPGTPASEYFNISSDYIFEIGLTPNRADAACHLGVARDLKVILDKEITLANVDSFSVDNTSQKVEIIVENPEACPRYSGLTISDVTVKPSPEWLQNRLKSLGLAPINNIVDITNFILHDLGQPLHAFDLDEVKGSKVIVKTLSAGTEFNTLDGEVRKLSSNDLMICNSEEGMCIAGIFGGQKSGVKESTKSIFLESAYFSPSYIRKTSQHHGLKTDASFRYERGTDPNITVYALKKAALLIKEIAGGTISSNIIDIYPKPVEGFEVETSYAYINKLIGKTIDQEIIKKIITGLNIKIKSEEGGSLKLEVPAYKVDVTREADVVEEVLRIYGYDNIELSERLSSAYLADFPEKDKDLIKRIISSLLVPNGFFEIITNSLTSSSYAQALNSQDSNIGVLNASSESLNSLRQTLLFSGLEVVSYNLNRKQKDLKLFEFGKTYQKTEKGYKESNRLGIFLTGNVFAESWYAPEKAVDIFYLKNIVLGILKKLKINNFKLQAINNNIFAEGISIEVNTKEIGTFGIVSNSILKIADLKQEVLFADFDVDLMLKAFSKDLEYEEISKFPEVRRDLSIVLDKKVTFEEIRSLALKLEKKLIREVNVFDVYEGENIGQGKKSYSVSFILLDFERTLTDKEIDGTMQKLITSFEKELGAIIRK